ESRPHEQPAHLGEFAEVEVRIGREDLGRAKIVHELERLQLGYTHARLLEHRREVVPVWSELDEAALVDRTRGARLPPWLERADQVAAPVVLHVQVAVQ